MDPAGQGRIAAKSSLVRHPGLGGQQTGATSRDLSTDAPVKLAAHNQVTHAQASAARRDVQHVDLSSTYNLNIFQDVTGKDLEELISNKLSEASTTSKLIPEEKTPADMIVKYTSPKALGKILMALKKQEKGMMGIFKGAGETGALAKALQKDRIDVREVRNAAGRANDATGSDARSQLTLAIYSHYSEKADQEMQAYRSSAEATAALGDSLGVDTSPLYEAPSVSGIATTFDSDPALDGFVRGNSTSYDALSGIKPDTFAFAVNPSGKWVMGMNKGGLFEEIELPGISKDISETARVEIDSLLYDEGLSSAVKPEEGVIETLPPHYRPRK